VFDIDDTLESTYACAKRGNFDRNAITACIANFDQQPIKPVWRLLRYGPEEEGRDLHHHGSPRRPAGGDEKAAQGGRAARPLHAHHPAERRARTARGGLQDPGA
jgi:hypothetical protein